MTTKTRIPLSKSGKEAIAVAITAAREAGEILKDNFREETHKEFKSRGNIVTDIDLKAEKSVISLLQQEYPNHNILTEESDPIRGNSNYTWILDPLDGTNNYAFGIPFFSTVIALTKGEDVQLGIVYDPIHDELFSAQKGKGTFLNNDRVYVTQKTSVKESLIGLDLGYVDDKGKIMLDFIGSIWPKMYAFRLMGSAALGMAYAACGRLDLYFHILLYPWELACGQLLVTEAGGTVSNWNAEPVGIEDNSVIASNKSVHADLQRLLQTP